MTLFASELTDWGELHALLYVKEGRWCQIKGDFCILSAETSSYKLFWEIICKTRITKAHVYMARIM